MEGKQEFCYVLFNKPYGVLCQFTGPAGRETLSLYGPFSSDLYPAGRLDADSEGLVLLTNDGALKAGLLDPGRGHPRTYLVQVEGVPPENALRALEGGVVIEGKKTLPARVRLLEEEPRLPARRVPIRYRKSVPTAWLEMTLREGRNRQVRKMTARVGHPTLRLVRLRIGFLELGALRPGEKRTLTPAEADRLRKEVAGLPHRF
jgi:23S rRNA pseudouridine2457 synthase